MVLLFCFPHALLVLLAGFLEVGGLAAADGFTVILHRRGRGRRGVIAVIRFRVGGVMVDRGRRGRRDVMMTVFMVRVARVSFGCKNISIKYLKRLERRA